MDGEEQLGNDLLMRGHRSPECIHVFQITISNRCERASLVGGKRVVAPLRVPSDTFSQIIRKLDALSELVGMAGVAQVSHQLLHT